jgi:hypothetical protein
MREELRCTGKTPAGQQCESYQGHDGEHLGPGERCTYVSRRGMRYEGTRCASRAGHADPMHDMTAAGR